MTDTMRAIVLDAPGPPDALTIRELPVRTPAPGWVPTLPDTLRSTRQHGVVCFTGMLSNVWTVRDFYPIDYRVYGFDQIVEAHTAMEAGSTAGKLVVTT